jgi:hypothetical protein
MNKLNFNRRLLIGIVISIQLLSLIIFFFSTLTLTPYDVRIFSEIPAVKTIYGPIDVDWVAIVKGTAHAICGVLNFLIAYFAIRYGLQRKTEMFQFLVVSIGIQLMLSAVLNFAMVGLVFYGGLWHIFSAMFITMMMFSSLATLSILFIYRDYLFAFANWQDRISTHEERELIRELTLMRKKEVENQD